MRRFESARRLSQASITRPRWRNGRRGGLKIRFPQGSVGSSPSLGSTQTGRQLVGDFIRSTREGPNPESREFYQGYFGLAKSTIGFHTTGQDISQFLSKLPRTNGGRHACRRAPRAFYDWPYSRNSAYNLNAHDNYIRLLESRAEIDLALSEMPGDTGKRMKILKRKSSDR
jgi:hypothetical protein